MDNSGYKPHSFQSLSVLSSREILRSKIFQIVLLFGNPVNSGNQFPAWVVWKFRLFLLLGNIILYKRTDKIRIDSRPSRGGSKIMNGNKIRHSPLSAPCYRDIRTRPFVRDYDSNSLYWNRLKAQQRDKCYSIRIKQNLFRKKNQNGAIWSDRKFELYLEKETRAIVKMSHFQVLAVIVRQGNNLRENMCDGPYVWKPQLKKEKRWVSLDDCREQKTSPRSFKKIMKSNSKIEMRVFFLWNTGGSCGFPQKKPE